MIAPSGKFWIAMPRVRASAPPALIMPEPERSPAYTMPTAIPSGILWSVTARTIIVRRARWLFGPSVWFTARCRCGMM